MTPRIRLEGLTARYPGFALGPVTLELAAGECLAVLGESGSGKSTLARAAVQLLEPSAAPGGRVWLDGQDLTALPPKELADWRMARFSICFQNSHGWLNPSLTLGQHLEELLARRYPRAERAGRAAVLAGEVGLEVADLGLLPRQASGGMVQKTLLALALALDPAFVVLDEPTGALDEVSRRQVLEVIRRRAAAGTAFLVVTHDVTVARQLCARTCVLYGGRVMELAPTSELLTDPRHPYSRGLIRSFPELYPQRDLWGIRPGPGPREGECPFRGRCTQCTADCDRGVPELADIGPGRQVACWRGGIAAALTARDITKQFDGKPVLTGANLRLDCGETVALVGPSGIGKSTLAAILAGFLAPDSGRVLVNGEPADYNKLHRTPGGVQLLWQDSFAALNPRFTVERAVAEPGILAKLWSTPQQQRERVVQLLEQVGLDPTPELLARPTANLSGGQAQRVAMARALVLNPAVLVADEPTAQLDASGRANLLRLLKGMQNAAGCAMLVVTHDPHAARKIADRVLLLKAGRLEAVDPDRIEQELEDAQ